MADWDTAAIQANNQSTLVDVYHGAHIETATRIIKDDAIRSTLITDCESLVNARISVTWLAANYYDDSIYGNIQFRIPFQWVVGGRTVRWVERNTKFKKARYRFAICRPNGQLYKLTHHYDVHLDNGPLQFKNGRWIVNSKEIVEIILDDDVPRSQCKEIAFLHHYDRCRFKPDCPDKDLHDNKRASCFLAYILSSRNCDWNNAFTTIDQQTGAQTLNVYARMCAEQLYGSLATTDDTWNGRAQGSDAKELVLGACALLAIKRRGEAVSLIRQTASLSEFKVALESIVNNHFDVAYQLP